METFFANVSEITQLKTSESANTDGTFHENTTRRKSVSKEDLLKVHMKRSSDQIQIHTRIN